MILITGGLGFIGLNTARALLAQGEACVLTQHHSAHLPEDLKDEMGSRLFIEPLDAIDINAFLALGEKYPMTGIVHLAARWTRNPATRAIALFEDIQVNLASLANALQAAQEWRVKRISVASTVGVYGGVTEVPLREDQPLPLTAPFAIPAFKKCGEIVCDYIAARTGVECISMRFGGIYGPLSQSRAVLPNLLVHAAIEGTKPDLAHTLGGASAQDGYDMCYVKDAARAIALLQVTETLHHQVYNVASGRPTKNQDIVEAIKKVLPDFQLELPPGPGGADPDALPYQDITWLTQDTGYQPQYTTEQAIADYIGWLRVGNEY
jgi:UDP-glucose 4-epimerase